jgi:hypothetical protein
MSGRRQFRLVAGYAALAAALGAACGGRTVDVGSPGEQGEGGAPRRSALDANATDDAGFTLDATVTVDAGALAQSGSMVADQADGAACVDASVTSECDAPYLCAAEYDRSCQTDSDCVLIAEGQFCLPLGPCGPIGGPRGAISLAVVMQYEKDVSRTPGGQYTGQGGACPPQPLPYACCSHGQCIVEATCGDD